MLLDAFIAFASLEPLSRALLHPVIYAVGTAHVIESSFIEMDLVKPESCLFTQFFHYQSFHPEWITVRWMTAAAPPAGTAYLRELIGVI